MLLKLTDQILSKTLYVWMSPIEYISISGGKVLKQKLRLLNIELNIYYKSICNASYLPGISLPQEINLPSISQKFQSVSLWAAFNIYVYLGYFHVVQW